jgi:LPLT family lysophospholipid transporter-like MFS transporter
MSTGFYIIMAAQFFSALADNALLIAAIAILRDMHAPAEYEPLLKTFFTVSYVALAAFVGAFADSMPKWRVMFISNGIKILGCSLMFFDVHPLLAYAVVGLGRPPTRRPSTASSPNTCRTGCWWWPTAGSKASR